jgi:hypothetical protein
MQKAGVRFRAADMPEANEMVVGIMAVIAQGERKMISQGVRDGNSTVRPGELGVPESASPYMGGSAKPRALDLAVSSVCRYER